MDPTTPQETPPVTSIRSGGVTTAKAEMTPGSRERELAGGAMVTPRRPNRRRYGARTGSASRASRSGSRSTSISDEAYLNKHLPDAVSDDRATQVVPPTTGVAVPAKPEKTQGAQGKSLKRNIKATVLTFRAIVDRPHVARVQLLLCNISDRALYFKLKSNVGSNVSALPAGNAEIPPHAQVRLILTWTRPPQYDHWRDVPPPKLLIVTKFMDDTTGDNDASATSIRLIARVSSSKTCFASNPPVEQLLLDAVGKSENMEVSTVMHEGTPRTSDRSQDQVAPGAKTGKDLADFLNGLDDRGLLILILILLASMYIISRLCDKKQRK